MSTLLLSFKHFRAHNDPSIFYWYLHRRERQIKLRQPNATKGARISSSIMAVQMTQFMQFHLLAINLEHDRFRTLRHLNMLG